MAVLGGPMIRAVGPALKCLSLRVLRWALFRQQKWVQRMSTKRKRYREKRRVVPVFYCAPFEPRATAVRNVKRLPPPRRRKRYPLAYRGVHRSCRHRLKRSPFAATKCVKYKKHKEQSLGKKVEMLCLGGAKEVPLTDLYKSLIHRDFFHAITRNDTTRLITEHGSFVIRPSMHTDNPLTLSVFIRDQLSHICIRQRTDTKFALGTPKPDEKSFVSIDNLVDYHRTSYIKKPTGATSLLLQTPAKKSMTS